MGEENDPTRIRSIAVHREDVATALEATIRTDRQVVLRITPPFSGRMRARLHEATSDTVHEGRDEGSEDDSEHDDGNEPDPIHVDPGDLVADPPSYPEVDETAAAFPDADVETRYERHADAVDAWREAVRDSLAERVTISIDGTAHEVDVSVLG
ncbi:hypothetical protein JCM18237_05910 [Halorubrum luteum]